MSPNVRDARHEPGPILPRRLGRAIDPRATRLVGAQVDDPAFRISEQPIREPAFSRFDNLRSADRPIYDRARPAPPRSFPGT